MPARGKKAAVEPKGATGEVEDRSNENKATASTTRSTASFNAPSVQSILQDSLTKISLEYWAPGNAQKKPFSASIIEQIYSEEIGGSEAATSRLVLLELSFYLENYLWPNYTPGTCTYAHLMSIVLMINEKCRESVPAWDCFKSDKTRAQLLLVELLALRAHESMTMKDRAQYVIFLVNLFQSIWNEVVQPVVVRLVSIPIWCNLIESKRAHLFESHSRLNKTWSAVQKLHATAFSEAGATDQSATTNSSAMDVDAPEAGGSKPKKGSKAKKASSSKAIKSESNDGDAWKQVCAPGSMVPIDLERNFLVYILNDYFTHLNSIEANGAAVDPQLVHYLERFLELQIDLLNQLPTRRFYRTLFESSHFIILSKASPFYNLEQGKLFKQLLSILHFYEHFEIDDFTGEALTDAQVSDSHYKTVQRAQSTAFKHFVPELRRFALTNVASVDTRSALLKWLEPLTNEQLADFCTRLDLIGAHGVLNSPELDRERLLDVFIAHLERRQSQIDAINAKSLYPDEKLLWDTNAVPDSTFTGESPLALPKLNLQFLTFHDHLLRNFTLFRLESAYEIREDVEDAVKRMQPRCTIAGTTVMRGWARMALPISEFAVTHVAKKIIGEPYPEKVFAEVKYSLPTRGDTIRGEWDSLKAHDIVFLVSIKAKIPDSAQNAPISSSSKSHGKHNKKNQSSQQPDNISSFDFPTQYGIVSVRGAEVVEIKDENGRVISDADIDVAPSKDKSRARSHGTFRSLKISLDPAQYHHDISLPVSNAANDKKIVAPTEISSDETPGIYKTFNLIIRRSSKENNFKAILETIRQLMNTKFVVPKWLTDVFLGYGDPTASTNVEAAQSIDYVDTFLSVEHLRQSFPGKRVSINSSQADKKKSKTTAQLPDTRELYRATFEGDEVKVDAYQKKSTSPYPSAVVKRNPIQFTPTQIGAISTAMNKGLTLVVGPPGTGKTDVSVQIVSNWYHNFPHQRTLLVTHSNNALNQLFEKIMVLDVDERHMLRLGHGGGMLETEKDFSKPGRVNYMLQRRMDLLSRVEQLAVAINHPTDVAYTVETAKNFHTVFVVAKWEKFLHQMAQEMGRDGLTKTASTLVSTLFPFTKFFLDLPQPLFPPTGDIDHHIDFANQLWNEIQNIFSELEECRAFEVLRSSYDRGNYLLTKQAKIVAMTCTHAALKRGDLVKLGFKFDNILMEEAGQILEIETFIPMMLQEQALDAEPRLKRVVLIGDHNQLPPVVKNMAFQRYAHLDQSLFTRFVRLGVPTITLDAQGRARPSLAALYAWRYSGLSNLSHVEATPEFQQANPGFAYDYQLIDVPDYQGMGEIEPNPHFIQNLGEAEFVVATYMYMRILGYPREKISIITSYNGQKHLIRDVIKQRCAWDPRFGTPHKITTVDRFQGQQNDYILLSLVRTRTIGHLRDVRRLVVAMSRARLGLYIFGRRDLFKDCYELTPTFSKLLQRPTTLHLVKGEQYGSITRGVNEKVVEPFEIQDVVHMGQVVLPNYASAGPDAPLASHIPEPTNGDDASSNSSDDVLPYEEANQEDDTNGTDSKMDVSQ
jgi:intron-binding protein aquarius